MRRRRAIISGCCCAGLNEKMWSAPSVGAAEKHYAAYEVQRRDLRLVERRGGWHTPFFNGDRPQFYFRTTDVTGSMDLPAGVEMVMPGDTVTITVKLIAPVAMEKELRFAIHEGGCTVGAGVVAEIIE